MTAIFFSPLIDVCTVTGCSMVTSKIKEKGCEMTVSHKINTVFSLSYQKFGHKYSQSEKRKVISKLLNITKGYVSIKWG